MSIPAGSPVQAEVDSLGRGSTRALEHQARLVAEISQGFASTLDIAETLRNAITRFRVFLDAEAASIFLLEDDGRQVVCHDCVGPVDVTGLRLDAGQGIVGKAVRENTTQIIRDVQAEPEFAASVDAGTGFTTRSILCVPLTLQGRCLGALELINKNSGDHLFSAEDQHLATAIAAAASLAIRNAQMAAALVEQELVRKELALAREIQERLLPAPVPGLPVTGLNRPAGVVSGDFYDHLTLPDGRTYFALGDVSGKGMNAALLMAKTTSLMRCLAKSIEDPAELLARVNEELCETASHGMFVTVVAGFLDAGDGSLWLANAGHPPALLFHAGGRIEALAADSPPLGVLPGIVPRPVRVALGHASLYLYSDGLTESPGRMAGADTGEGPWLGVAGLEALICQVSDLPPAERLERIVEQARGADGRQRDDITLLVVERQGR